MPLRTETRDMDHGAVSFGARLRAERQRRQISIATIAETTKILGALLEGVENDDVSRWPTGLYRRSFMRADAHAIGLDPEATVKEFLERFPDPETTTPPTEASSFVVVPDAGPPPLRSSRRGWRIGAPKSGIWFAPGTLVQGFGSRCLAVGVDWFVLSVTGLALFAALGMFWAPLSVAAAAYYSASILFLGNTPGVSLFARLSSADPDDSTLHHYHRA
jgi:transcriptional regulator with XRE-family HTH domain